MTAKLVIIAGPDKDRTLQLNSGQTVQLGRSPAASIQLTDPTVSRVHCEIDVGNDNSAKVLNISQQGTRVNGEQVGERVLQPGDVIVIGTTELRYTAGDATVGVALPEVDSLVGKRLEEYMVEKVIARGNNGVIFKATDLTSNSRLVALKVLQPALMRNEEEMQRFVRAMRTMIPVRHPHLVSVYGGGKSGPFCYIVMELVDGDSVATLMERGEAGPACDWKVAYRMAVHIGRALEYAHELSILHRNVTAENVLLRRTDKVAKLGDLMLAKALEGSLAVQVTRPGKVIGDVHYMAPERMSSGTVVDTRSDLYGLGATIYALLTGQPPYGAAGTLPEIVARMRTTTPESPRLRQPAMPDAFAGVVMKLLAKKPEDRYDKAKTLLTDLTEIGHAAGVNPYFA